MAAGFRVRAKDLLGDGGPGIYIAAVSEREQGLDMLAYESPGTESFGTPCGQRLCQNYPKLEVCI